MRTLPAILLLLLAGRSPAGVLVGAAWNLNCVPALGMWHSAGTAPTNVAMTTWMDSSGNGRTATASGNITNIGYMLKGWPAIRFTNTSSAKFTFPDWNPNSTFFALDVVKLPTLALQTSSGALCTWGATNHEVLGYRGDNGKETDYDNANPNFYSSGTPNCYGAFVETDSSVSAGGSGTFYLNGTNYGFGGSGTLATNMFINTYGWTTGVYAVFDLADFAIYTAVPTAAQQARLRSYLWAKYKLRALP